ncbi:MAG: c-type cytochrome [Gammaproteobacteria bacterium]
MKLAIAFAACGLCSLAQAADVSMPAPPAAVADCVTCHGVAGRGNRAVGAPRLAGLPARYTEQQLRAFREGWRGSGADDIPGWEMQAVAASLSDARIRAAAEWFAGLSPHAAADTVNGDAARGEALYAGCAECHGSDGRGRDDTDAPALAGRSDWYLLRQLENYRAGRRGYHPDDERGQRMAASAAQLPDDAAVRAVVTYINRLK